MTKQRTLTQQTFDELLAWLDADRERAGMKYEDIRHSLIKFFIWRGCDEAEDLADEAINRVTEKVSVLSKTYEGEPALYFYGVAKNVYLEYRKQQTAKVAVTPELIDEAPDEQLADEAERRFQCMELCLQKLSARNRELITLYYQRHKQTRVDSRKELARQLGISSETFRVRMHRIRLTLYQCMQECLAQPDETS
jgi:RNA polymerase sigma factor (sigma-70 family)